MRGRRAVRRFLLSTMVLAAFGVMGTVAVSILAGPLPAGADQVINGCTIVANPMPIHHTACPGANLLGTDLDGAEFCRTTMPDGTVNSRDS